MVNLFVAAALFAGQALAGGTASPKPPPPPKVDLSTLPASASVKQKGADGKEHPVHARLLAEKPTVAAGETVRVGLHLTQKKGWHTYWKSPGEIGQPTTIAWSLPTGASVTPHVYPIPQRFDQEGMVSFGYEDQVLLISELTLPADLPPGAHTLKADAGWLVCETACIPGEASLALPLEVAPPGTKTAVGPLAPLFEHFAAQHPADPATVEGVTFETALSVSGVTPNGTFRAALLARPTGDAKLQPPGKLQWPTFTPIAGQEWMVDAVTVRATEDGGILAVIQADAFEPEPLPTDDVVGGLFQLKVGDRWVRTEVTLPLPWVADGATETKAALFDIQTLPPAGGAEGDGDASGSPSGDRSPDLASMAVVTPEAPAIGGMSLLMNLALAFVGGLLLNIMPCVLPVLTLKLYGLVEQADVGRAEQRKAGAAYTAGILVSFLALAAAILVLRIAFGVEVDWGFQFQYPPYVAALATVVFAFGLSLFGVFEIPAFGVGAASEAAGREGPVGYFFTGVFATLLATPCSAPFLGTAIAYAFTAPAPVLVGIFAMVGLGLAAPFLLIAWVPAAYRLLPRPGAWMDGFKQLLGFTLIATTVWLVGVLMTQIGPDRTTWFLAFLVFVALGCWAFGRIGGLGSSGPRQLAGVATGLGITAAGAVFLLDLAPAEAAATCDDGEVRTSLDFADEVPWQPFTEERVAALAGRPVFIDFTADWCLSCKVNERVVLETAPVRAAMAEHGIVPLKADWTRRDPTITEWLRRHNKAGVPFYLVLPADPEAAPIALPEVITPKMVIEAFAAAR